MEKPIGLIIVLVLLGGCILVGSAAGLGLIPMLTVGAGAAAEANANREAEWQATRVAVAMSERYDQDFSPGEALDLADSIMQHDEQMQSDALDTVEQVAISGDAAQAAASIAQAVGNVVIILFMVVVLGGVTLLALGKGGKSG